MAMAADGVVSQLWIDGFDALPSHNDEVHVLAVDDSIVDRKVIEHLLKISSCKVTAVDSGIRALQFLGLDEDCSPVGFDGLKVDLIITDYCMPGMTGYELLKRIKESSAFREIPVVIMSSENIVGRIDRCLEEGAEDFIVKPVKLSDVKRIKDFMSSREIKSKNYEKGNNVNKRKSRDTCSEISSSSPSMSSSLSSSPLSFSNPPSPPLSPATPMLPLSAPCSPTRSLDSPTRRHRYLRHRYLKTCGSDQDLSF